MNSGSYSWIPRNRKIDALHISIPKVLMKPPKCYMLILLLAYTIKRPLRLSAISFSLLTRPVLHCGTFPGDRNSWFHSHPTVTVAIKPSQHGSSSGNWLKIRFKTALWFFLFLKVILKIFRGEKRPRRRAHRNENPRWGYEILITAGSWCTHISTCVIEQVSVMEEWALSCSEQATYLASASL